MASSDTPDITEVAASLSQSERFVLEWLSREDWSQVGECKGAAFDRLYSLGLIREGPRHPSGDDFRAVGLNERGIAVRNHLLQDQDQ